MQNSALIRKRSFNNGGIHTTIIAYYNANELTPNNDFQGRDIGLKHKAEIRDLNSTSAEYTGDIACYVPHIPFAEGVDIPPNCSY